MNKRIKAFIPTYRIITLGTILGLATMGLIARIVYLQVLQTDFLQNQGDSRTVRTVSMHAYRGIITDRKGEPLAVTTPADSIWINPKQVQLETLDYAPLQDLLSITSRDLNQKVTSNQNKSFVYLQRHVNPNIGKQIKALELPGVYVAREYRRYYPSGEVAAHLVGFTDIDDQGQEAVELLYDDWLKGQAGKKHIMRDRLGRIIDDEEVIQQPEVGNALQLSIDKKLQFLAYRELKASVAKQNAVGGSAVILDVKTGEVLAMVNQPAYNPNNRAGMAVDSVRNRAVTDTFEPGSVIKAFSVAAAIESGLYTPSSTIDTTPGRYMLDGHLIRDIRNYGVLDLTGVIRKSSNVGISKVIGSLPPRAYTDMLAKFGFGEDTGSGFPGERSGRVVIAGVNDKFTQATQAFGYGLSVTTLQLARAFAILANNGVKLPVSLIKLAPEQVPQGEQVIRPETAQQVLAMLRTVIAQGGSGTRAGVAGFHVTGKTGTTRKVTSEGYATNKHRGIFAGAIPASDPKLVMVVMIDEPRNGAYYGGLVAAPVFASVMSGAARLLNLSPDDLASVTLLDMQKEPVS